MFSAKLIYCTFLAFSLPFMSCSDKKDSENQNNHEQDVLNKVEKEDLIKVPDYSNVSSEVKEQISLAFKSYLSLKNALVSENAGEAKKAAQLLSEQSEKIDIDKLEENSKSFVRDHLSMIKLAATQISNSSTIENQRAQMNIISTTLYSVVKATASNSTQVYYQYCPMANEDEGGYWISEKVEILNPYFGDKMLNCGENKESLNVKS